MEKFEKVISRAVPLSIEDIDTDQIIPARFLKATTREGFGENLFRDWRFMADNSVKSEFPLNNKSFSGSVLVAGRNFGCGSSREHAAWALADYGFKVVIGTSFADIFYDNCINNQLLPVQLASEQMDQLFDAVANDASVQITVNLQQQIWQQQIWY